MTSFRFVDQRGVGWMVLPALPADYPDTGDRDNAGALPRGFTFRSDGGELRVLPRAAFPRRVSARDSIPTIGRLSRVSRTEAFNWEDLLARSIPWPPA